MMAALTIAGCVAAAAMAGPAGFVGFALGAAFSFLTAVFFHRVAMRAGTSQEAAASFRASSIALGLRYFIFGAAGYVIVNYFGASLPAIFAGCFVAAAAVILEILYELIYART